MTGERRAGRAALVEPARGRPVALRTGLIVLGAILFVGVALRVLDPERAPWMRSFLIVFGSLLIQSVPFVLIGAFASAAIEVFIPISTLEHLAGYPRALQLPAAALAGFAFPICECGSVPVARRLAQRGLTPGAAITFMLAAPVLNPVVIASTIVAFRGRTALWAVVLGRIGLGFAVSILVGWVLANTSKDQLLRPSPEEDPVPLLLEHPDPRWQTFFGHLGNDFLFMGRYLMLGAAAAALVQTFLPQTLIARVAGLPVLSIIVMMGLALVLSLCSESDAFIAASFVRFGPAAQIAFLVFGPMVDLKLVSLYLGTFTRGFTRTPVATVGTTVFVAALWLTVIIG